jgi:putative oxidoreductase
MLAVYFERMRDKLTADGWALLPLRLVVGYGFAAHGFAKLARGPEHFATILAAIGIPAPLPIAWATSLIELLGGVGVMVGAGTASLAFPLIAIMLTAMFGVHFRYGFSSIRLLAITPSGAEFGPIGCELNLMYIAALFALAVGKTTPLSVDRFLSARRSRKTKGLPP